MYAARLVKPEGLAQISPGRRPGYDAPVDSSPERAQQEMLLRPFRACMIFGVFSQGGALPFDSLTLFARSGLRSALGWSVSALWADLVVG